MASLNLTPNTTVMIVEAGVFLATFFVGKKLLLEPYLSVNAKRKALTEGSQSEAEHLQVENQRTIEKIDAQLSQVADDSRKLRDRSLQKAKADRDALVHSASDEANKTIEDMRQSLAKELAEERSRIPTLVDQLTKEFVAKIIPA